MVCRAQVSSVFRLCRWDSNNLQFTQAWRLTVCSPKHSGIILKSHPIFEKWIVLSDGKKLCKIMHNFLGGWIIKSLGGAFNERDINWEAFRLKIYLANNLHDSLTKVWPRKPLKLSINCQLWTARSSHFTTGEDTWKLLVVSRSTLANSLNIWCTVPWCNEVFGSLLHSSIVRARDLRRRTAIVFIKRHKYWLSGKYQYTRIIQKHQTKRQGNVSKRERGGEGEMEWERACVRGREMSGRYTSAGV